MKRIVIRRLASGKGNNVGITFDSVLTGMGTIENRSEFGTKYQQEGE